MNADTALNWNRPLPSFTNPPVIETVLGVQFDPIKGFTNAHLGSFWQWLTDNSERIDDPLRDSWTQPSDAVPLEPSFERFGEESAWSALEMKLRVVREPTVRLLIRNKSGDAMIQLQNGRLHYNWIGAGGQTYRRYNTVRPRFDALFGAFSQYLEEHGFGPLSANQWEITYVNHLRKGTVWESSRDWPKLFPGLPGPWCAPNSVRLESIGGAWHFEIEPRRGRLHVEIKHARTDDDPPEEVLRVTLTARGLVVSGHRSNVSWGEGLELGRRAIVLTFKDMTSPEAHRIWEIQDDQGA